MLLKQAQRLLTGRKMVAGLLCAPISPNCWVRSDRSFEIMFLQAVQERERERKSVPWSNVLHHLKGKWHLQMIDIKRTDVGASVSMKNRRRAAGWEDSGLVQFQHPALRILIPSSQRLSRLHWTLLSDVLIPRDGWGVRSHAVSCSETHRQRWQLQSDHTG